MMYQWRGEFAQARQQAELDIVLCRQEGFVLWLAIAMIVRGWSVMKLGNHQEGLHEVESGVAAFRATGAGLAQTYILSLLADAHRQLGQYDKGLKVVTEALAVGRKNGERVFEADLHRLHGQLLFERAAGTGLDAGQSLPEDVFQAVQACYQRSVRLARKQQARSFELRAMTDLARLWGGPRPKAGGMGTVATRLCDVHRRACDAGPAGREPVAAGVAVGDAKRATRRRGQHKPAAGDGGKTVSRPHAAVGIHRLRDVDPVAATVYVLLHLGCLGVFFVAFTTQAVMLFVCSFLARAVAVSVVYHRYFAHRTFQTSRAMRVHLRRVRDFFCHGRPAVVVPYPSPTPSSRGHSRRPAFTTISGFHLFPLRLVPASEQPERGL